MCFYRFVFAANNKDAPAVKSMLSKFFMMGIILFLIYDIRIIPNIPALADFYDIEFI